MNVFREKRALLDAIMALMTAAEITPEAVALWADAHRIIEDAKETKADDGYWGKGEEEDARREAHGPRAQLELEFDCAIDGPGDFVRRYYEDVEAALDVLLEGGQA